MSNADDQCAVIVNCKPIRYNFSVMPTQVIGTTLLHKVPKDLQEVLKSNHDVFQLWNRLTPLARNEWVCWVTMVKKDETRQEHFGRVALIVGQAQKSGSNKCRIIASG